MMPFGFMYENIEPVVSFCLYIQYIGKATAGADNPLMAVLEIYKNKSLVRRNENIEKSIQEIN